MMVSVYLICAPGMDRVCVQTRPPTTLVRKPGTKVYRIDVAIKDFEVVDEVLTCAGEEDVEDVTESLQALASPL